MKRTKNRQSSRLQSWDYSQNGAYFITLCCKNKRHYFGEIIDEKMNLSPIGIIADVFWHEIKHHAKHVELGEFVVMPNHIHGIIIINDPSNNQTPRRDKACLVPTNPNVFTGKEIGKQRFQNQGKNTISSIIGSYKAAVSKHAHRLGYEFNWQPRFYDHIIRDEAAFLKISEYIKYNPRTWKSDRFHPDTLLA